MTNIKSPAMVVSNTIERDCNRCLNSTTYSRLPEADIESAKGDFMYIGYNCDDCHHRVLMRRELVLVPIVSEEEDDDAEPTEGT